MDGRRTSNWWSLWGALVLLWALFPLAWMVSLSFKDPATLRSGNLTTLLRRLKRRNNVAGQRPR